MLATDQRPHLDPDGLLRWGGHWVAVSPNEERALELLLARWDHVVPRASLAAAVWPDGDTDGLSCLVFRLRKRIEPLGLTISAVRSRGFLLGVAQRHHLRTTTRPAPAWPAR